MKAIIVAAGMGRRLNPYTDDRPKCLVPIRGRTILDRQLDALRAAGVDDVVLVRGYLAEKLDRTDLRYYENPAFRTNNILASLLYAAPELDDDFVFSYSDIIYHPDVARALVAARAEISLVVDRRWADVYVGRELHPVSEAELARVDGEGRVLRVGKRAVPAAEARGEFIGLARFSRAAGRRLRDEFQRVARDLEGRADRRFGLAPSFEVAYLTDMLNLLIEQGVDCRAVEIEGRWREIDTTEDLACAERDVDW